MANKKLLKTYHGIPKTPIDDFTVFYASFDGTTVAEVGGLPITSTLTSHAQALTGLGLVTKSGFVLKYAMPSGIVQGVTSLTIDVLVYYNGDYSSHQYMYEAFNSAGLTNGWLFNLRVYSDGILKFATYNEAGNSSLLGSGTKLIAGYHHIRVTMAGSVATVYLDGKINCTGAVYARTNAIPTFINVGQDGSNINMFKSTISDLSISNIDRGSYFPTLPQDFIDGNARIAPAFSEQRQTYSDALTSEYKIETVTAFTETKRQYTKTQATSGVWASGDTIKVKGLAGEIISGVIDSDTALARVTISNTGAGGTTLNIDDVTKLSVNDTFLLYNSDGITLEYGSSTHTISAIDTTNKIITFSPAINGGWQAMAGHIIVDTTASSSSPLVKTSLSGTATAGASTTITFPATFSAVDDAYNNLSIQIISGTGAGQNKTITDYTGSTKIATVSAWTTNPDNTSVFMISGVTVTGTWSSLGTNQATFTLGTTPALTNQNLDFEYSLNEVAGQGGIPEVLTSVLGGEINTKIVDPSFVKISTDYKGKISGSVVENANISKVTMNNIASGLNTLQIPSSVNWVESGQPNYNNITFLDFTNINTSQNINTQIPQQLFSFDLIALVERKYGPIPAVSVADKVLWLKGNLDKIVCNWYGFGSCPSGNKAYFRPFDNGIWSTTIQNNTLASPSLLAYSIPTGSIPTIVQSDGFCHFLAYTDASDGVTASTINTDYISLDVTLNYNSRLSLPNVPSTVSGRKLALNPTVHVTDDLLGSNPNTIEYATGDGKIHFEVEGETLDIYSGGVKADFTGKVSGSVVENCNVSKYIGSGSLQNPSAFTSEISNYSNINLLNGVSESITTGLVNTAIPQQLFSFDVIKTYERKYGVIPSATQSTADKIAWLKLNGSVFTAKWYGYGTCPSGNKAYLSIYSNSTWATMGTNTNGTPTLITAITDKVSTDYVSKAIDANGMINYLAYTDMASTTSPTLLVMSGHGLVVNEVYENVTRGVAGAVTSGYGISVNSIGTASTSGQMAGDVINKYHLGVGKTATTGTTETTVVTTTAHGMTTGDYIKNATRGYALRKVTVIDTNTFTVAQVVGQTSGDTFNTLNYFGQQTADGTTTTQLQLTAHGLSSNSIVENVTRNPNVPFTLTSVTTNSIIMNGSISSQQSGDVINKYRYTSINRVSIAGTDTTTVVINAHGLSTGDYVKNASRGYTVRKITVVDVNTFTFGTPIASQVVGDLFDYYPLLGIQTAEAGVIPSTIYTDYVSLDITMKPSYKSVGEDFGGVQDKRLDVLSRGKNLFDVTQFISNGSSYYSSSGNGVNINAIDDRDGSITMYFIKLKPNTTYTLSTDVSTGLRVYEKGKVSPLANISSNKTTFTTTNVIWYCVKLVEASSFPKLIQNIQIEEGTTATSYTPYVSDTKSLTLANPLRKVSSTVFDKYAEGVVNRNVSNWVDFTTSPIVLPTCEGNTTNAKTMRTTFANVGAATGGGSNAYLGILIKHTGESLVYGNTSTLNYFSNACYTVNQLQNYINIPNIDSGFDASYIPTNAEVKSYFYGYKMCHSDGVSPFQVNEVNYTPSTWAEWSKQGGTTTDATGMEWTSDGVGYKNSSINTNLKVSTKYGVLYNVVSNTTTGNMAFGSTDYPFSDIQLPYAIGNNKIIATTKTTFINNKLIIYMPPSGVGEKIKIKDVRLFELPTGSTIESDFNTMTADQLTAKYQFYGLNPKNWKSVVDGSGQTATLPVAQAPNYTPYKMLYQLATPTTEAVTTTAINAYDFGSILVDGGSVPGKTNILTGSLLPATSTSWVSASKTNVETLNGTSLSITSNALGNIPQIKVKFNIVDMLEQKYGPLPCNNDIASKVAWVKGNLSSILGNNYVFGLGSSGNKVNTTIWNTVTPNWQSALSHLLSVPTLINYLTSVLTDKIDSSGFVHFISYADQATTTNSTTLALTAHGLGLYDIVENVTRGNGITVISGYTPNSVATFTTNGQTSGDVINKYKYNSVKTAAAGTNATTLVITGHGLTIGSYVCVKNSTLGSYANKYIVTDANTLTITTGSLSGQASGNSVTILTLLGTQTAESTIIPSTINMDYISLDVSLKPITGYDMLSPENARRDDGKSNIVLIKKEVKEIKTMFPVTSMDGIVVYGDYNSKIAMRVGTTLNGGYIVSNMKAFLTSLSTRLASGAIYNIYSKFDLLDDFSVIDSTISSALTNGLQTNSIMVNTSYTSLVSDTKLLGNSKNWKRGTSGKIFSAGDNTLVLTDSLGYFQQMIDVSIIPTGTKYVPMACFISRDSNGMLNLILIASPNSNYIALDGGSTRLIKYPLPNNPLIK